MANDPQKLEEAARSVLTKEEKLEEAAAIQYADRALVRRAEGIIRTAVLKDLEMAILGVETDMLEDGFDGIEVKQFLAAHIDQLVSD